MLFDELRDFAIFATLAIRWASSGEAKVDAKGGFTDDIGGESEGQVGEGHVVFLGRGKVSCCGVDVGLHGGDQAGQVRGLVEGDDGVSHSRPP